MTKQHGTTAAAMAPGDPFLLAHGAYEQARDGFTAAAPDAKQFELPDGAHDLMSKASDALDAMMRIEAPTMFALFLKLRALALCPFPWALGDYTDRLTADAGTLAMQFPKVWLERWKGHGGSVIADPHRGGQLAIFKPEFFLSADAAALEARQKEAGYELSDEQRSWHRNRYDGQMSELGDMLDDVPGAKATLHAMVAENPAKGLPEIVGEGAL